ncbi:hypothetical protein BJV82DRAFT_606675 [Fennellomyces sp. T-0311]|nr:hypothetical protein BJV82DRAFT_606675 [Fennellomyces sp. T-0311]
MSPTVHSNSKVILITGATGGLGRLAAKRFLAEGHTVVITGRSSSRLDETVQWLELSSSARARLHTIVLDLESLASIRKAVETFKALDLPLDVLINNAGTTLSSHEFVAETTKVEKTIFVNAVAPWYLSMLMKPLMHPGSRVLFVASNLHDPKTKGPFATMSNGPVNDPNLFQLLDGKKNYDTLAYYKISKTAMIWVAYQMARESPDLNILAFCPGFVPITDLNRQQPWVFRAALKYILRYTSSNAVSPQQSISEYLYYATSEELANVTGQYFEFGKKAKSSVRSQNVTEAIKFWNLSSEICNAPEYALKK